MRTIYKYPLQIAGEQVVKIHRGFEFLMVAMQHGIPCMWCQVDTTKPEVEVPLLIFGTGHEIPKDKPGTYTYHLGSFQDGSFVGHLYIKDEDEDLE